MQEQNICFAEDLKYRYLRINNDFFIFCKNRLKDNFVLYSNLSQKQIDILQAYLNRFQCEREQITLSNDDYFLNRTLYLKDIESLLYQNKQTKKFSICNFSLTKDRTKLILFASKENDKIFKCKVPEGETKITLDSSSIEKTLRKLAPMSFNDNTWRLYIPTNFSTLQKGALRFIDAIFYTQNTKTTNYCVFLLQKKR